MSGNTFPLVGWGNAHDGVSVLVDDSSFFLTGAGLVTVFQALHSRDGLAYRERPVFPASQPYLTQQRLARVIHILV